MKNIENDAEIIFPKLEFTKLSQRTEDELFEYINNSNDCQFLVYMRIKYDWEEKWEYLIEYCCFNYNTDTLEWLFDWDEGQQNVEYLGIFCF